MLYDRSDLYDVAERIAFTEGRITRLQGRLHRLAQEGSDVSREQEMLIALSANLSQLYARQAKMRSSSWRSPLARVALRDVPMQNMGKDSVG